jgi:hypothetical protein
MATTQTVVTVGTDYVSTYPTCDPANNEIIWGTSNQYGVQTFRRASATGTNQRTITSLSFPSDGTSWGVQNNGELPVPDKIFYTNSNYDETTRTGSTKLYYLSTSTVNSTGILVATFNGYLFLGNYQSVLANGSMVLANAYVPPPPPMTMGTFSTIRASLPNGTTGTPPKFMDGQIFGGVIDSNTFYGSVSNATNVPTDAVVKCPTSNCSSPTIIARGQGLANYFAADSTAIYWTTSGTTATAVWKLAK